MAKTDDVFEKFVNPHDAAFKSAFQKKRLATSFFRNYLPKNIVKHVDFRSLRISDRSYVDEKLKDRHSDIVYQAKIRGGIGFLYILFEHQSKPDHWMIFRLLSYMVNIWKEFIDQQPGTKRLPVIFPDRAHSETDEKTLRTCFPPHRTGASKFQTGNHGSVRRIHISRIWKSQKGAVKPPKNHNRVANSLAS